MAHQNLLSMAVTRVRPRRPSLASLAMAVLIAAGPVAEAQVSGSVLLSPSRANLKAGVPRGVLIPTWYPSYFERAGIFRKHDSERRAVHIDAQRYPLGPGFVVSTRLRREADISEVEPGSPVGFSIGQGDDGRPYVDHLWVLPEGLVEGDGDRHGLVVK